MFPADTLRPATPPRPDAAHLEGRGDPPFWEMLSYLVSHKLSRVVSVRGLGITLYVREGRLEAASGYRLLGEVLIQHHFVDPTEIAPALASGQSLGQYFLGKRRITGLQLRAALRQQVRETLDHLLSQTDLPYDLGPAQTLPSPTASIEGTEFLAQTLGRQPLALGMVYQLADLKQEFTVDVRSWQVLRWINGRRTLSRVVQRSGLQTEEVGEAIRGLLQHGAIEQTNLLGLRFIVPRRLPLDSTKHPPGNLRANLFLKHIDGQQNVWQIQSVLNLAADETMTVLASLHRDGLVEIMQGRQEFDRLMHTF